MVDPTPRSRGGPCIITLERGGATRPCSKGVAKSPTTFPLQTPPLSVLAPELVLMAQGGGALSSVDGEQAREGAGESRGGGGKSALPPSRQVFHCCV